MTEKDRLIIGLTGSFASGCRTIVTHLEGKDFKQLSLTTKIKEVAKGRKLPLIRENLQDIGDELRKKNGYDYFARIVSAKIDKSSNKKFVVKSFRNYHEIKFFSEKYQSSFILFNIDAEKKIRYKRVKKKYTKKEIFDRDDERDSGEGQPEYGQHVRLCVDNADVVINNNNSFRNLYKKIDRYLELIKNPGTKKPFPQEINMTDACHQSTQTGCLKRAVGAILTKSGQIIASGYNSTPLDKVPCTSLKYCYREYSRQCPKCKTPIQIILNNCNKCGMGIPKERLSELEKNLDLCRAIHAEERAILQTAKIGGQILKDTVLYTTTFPCLLCAKKIIEVGISKVIYIDPYPFREAYRILQENNIELIKFEGVKSKAFPLFYYRKP